MIPDFWGLIAPGVVGLVRWVAMRTLWSGASVGRGRWAVRVPATAVVVVLAVGSAGCGGGDGGGSPDGGHAGSSASAGAGLSVDAAYEQLREQLDAGCPEGSDCNDHMSKVVDRVGALWVAMEREDRERYAEPIGLLERSEEAAERAGRDGLGAVGNTQQILRPVIGVERWMRQNP